MGRLDSEVVFLACFLIVGVMVLESDSVLDSHGVHGIFPGLSGLFLVKVVWSCEYES